MMRLSNAAVLLTLAFMSPGVAQTSRPAYVIAEVERLNNDGWARYAVLAGAIIQKHGGQFLSRMNKTAAVAGNAPESVLLIQFPSFERAQELFASPEYKALIQSRDTAAKFRAYIVESGEGMPPAR